MLNFHFVNHRHLSCSRRTYKGNAVNDVYDTLFVYTSYMFTVNIRHAFCANAACFQCLLHCMDQLELTDVHRVNIFLLNLYDNHYVFSECCIIRNYISTSIATVENFTFVNLYTQKCIRV